MINLLPRNNCLFERGQHLKIRRGKGNRPDPFAGVGLSREQKVQVQELQKTMQPLMKEAQASKDRKTIQAIGKRFQAGLAKILDEEQLKKYKAATAKIRSGAKAKNGN